jgi:hypothetical protein
MHSSTFTILSHVVDDSETQFPLLPSTFEIQMHWPPSALDSIPISQSVFDL